MDLAIMAHPRCGPIAERLRERIDEMALDGTLAALAERRPALPAWGAVRLADELRARYERKTLRITLISTAALLMLAALYLLARIRTQRILAANEQRYRTFFYQAAAGTAEVDPEGRLLDLNETCCRIVGRARGDVIGRNIEELCHPEDRERTREAFRALVAGELPTYNMEKRYLHSDGSPVWVRVAASAVRDRGGRTLYVVGVVQDISARKRAEEALRQSEERYRTLVEANPVGVAFVSIRGDDYGRLYKVNQAYADMIGYTRDEIESGGVRWTDLTPEEWAQADRLAIDETSRDGHSRLYEKEYIRKDGTRVPILLACAAHGENGAAVTFVLDVSDRKRLEREVKWLSGLLPICASCKSVRDENGTWQPVDSYMHHRIAADFTHGLCPTCLPLYGGRPAE
jgi:PAS domain S-box-containing protein